MNSSLWNCFVLTVPWVILFIAYSISVNFAVFVFLVLWRTTPYTSQVWPLWHNPDPSGLVRTAQSTLQPADGVSTCFPLHSCSGLCEQESSWNSLCPALCIPQPWVSAVTPLLQTWECGNACIRTPGCWLQHVYFWAVIGVALEDTSSLPCSVFYTYGCPLGWCL